MRKILQLVNAVSLGQMLTALLCVILGFAVLYWTLAQIDAGLLARSWDAGPISFADALYFSVVTITSLGFGDIRPMGIARLFAGTEVVMGLSFFGLIVAKISSVKQDYILRRMYYADLIDRRFGKYVDQLDDYRKLHGIASTMLPDEKIDAGLTTTAQTEDADTALFCQLHSLLNEIRELMQFEIRDGGFFDDVSDPLVSQIYASVQGMMQHTTALYELDLDGMPAHVLRGNERWISELASIAEEIATLGQRHSRNDEIASQCAAILELSNSVRDSLVEAEARS